MTVHALMPVHNRLGMTRRFLECLRSQAADEPVNVVVIDDGSSDGSGEFLSRQPGVTLLKGDGSLWWGGGIELGLRHVLAIARAEDWVLFVNNDTEIKADFVQRLLDSARRNAPAAIGSVIRDVDPPHDVLSVGASVDPWRFVVRDRVDSPSAAAGSADDHLHDVDALSGRGVLFPLSAFRAAGTMRARWLPHYFADYELSLRVTARATDCWWTIAPRCSPGATMAVRTARNPCAEDTCRRVRPATCRRRPYSGGRPATGCSGSPCRCGSCCSESFPA